MGLFGRKLVALDSPLIKEHQNLCIRMSEVLKKAGLNFKSHSDESFQRFRMHPQPQLVLKALKATTESYEEQMASGESFDDDKKMLWRFLPKMGLRPTSDLLESIQKDVTINVYTIDNLLIFFNLDFFNHIHATIDEIFTIIWSRDSEREMKITLEAFRLIFMIKTKTLRKTFPVKTIPKHFASFTFSGVPQKIELELLTASPLFGDGGMAGYLVTQRTKRLS